MRVFSSTYTFDYSWPEVSTANWQKYCPWNKTSSHVIAVDTLSREVDPVTGIVRNPCSCLFQAISNLSSNEGVDAALTNLQLRTERLITCTQTCPVWVSTLLGATSPTSHIYETSYVSPADKRVTMCSTNLTWSNLLSVRETVVYEPDLSCSEPGHERTKFSQEARITALCGGWKKIKEKIEEASIERFRDNAKKGREGFEMVLEMSRRVWENEKEREAREKISA